LHIRSATSDDIPALMALEVSAVTAAHWSEEQYRAAFSQSHARRLVLVIEEDASLLGFLIAREVDRDWEIENIVIAETRRQQGLGSQLLVEFLNIARGNQDHSVFLEVRESNLAARRLYEKRGFTKSGHRKGYYRQPDEDAMVYRMALRSCTSNCADPIGKTPN
jgi:[ribosomal protein S18]-alanine N-acetyltransferase